MKLSDLLNKYRGVLTVVVATALLVGLIVVVTNSNVGVVSQTGSNIILQPTQPADPMADHRGGQTQTDSTVFDSLVGKAAPDFTLESYDGKTVTLSSLKGKNVILFFNEGLMCYPACWNQIAAFGSDKDFGNKNTVILNITVDPKKDWQQAVTKMPELGVATVLFDSDRSVSQTYGVLSLISSMHKGQFPGHTYIIVDKEGVIRFARDDQAMAVRNKELAAEIEKINQL